ncbi:Carnitine o-acetyltransferase, partial [Globisporangium splendens]
MTPVSAYGAAGFRECVGDYRNESDLEVASQSLYRFQTNLPRLPVPKLEETVALYLETIRPLTTAQEFATSKQLAQEFLRPGGLGRELHQRLVQRAADRQDTSYLAEWWNTWGYLQVRDPVVFNVSYFFHFADSVYAEQRSNVGRAAALLRGTMEFRRQLVDGTLEPEQLGGGAKKTPICSTAYKYMFNACRIPHRESDTYRIYDPATHNHVVVMRNNKFFSFELLDATTKEPLSFVQICHQLNRILDAAGSKESSVGVLSAENRDTWADARDELLRNGNEDALKVIESAVVIVNMDDYAPVSRTEVAHALWHGDGRNRFYDKCIQFAVFENGKAGLLGEHSMLDGMPMARYADYLVGRLQKGQINLGKRDFTTAELNRSLANPSQIQFRFSRATLDAIVAAEKTFDETVADHDLFVQSFYGYGSKAIKTFKCSPDAFAQVAIQLAYKKLFGINVATYEASQTRIFLHGRTETTRSCSQKSADFTDAMVDASGVPKSNEEKKKLLQDATNYHVQYMKRAAQGLGVDRHLLGLRMLLKPGEKVPFFEDPPMTKSRYWLISTSHLTNELFDGWGWGEVVPEGLGIAYSIKANSIQFNIACRKYDNWAARMGHLLEESLVEMQQLFAVDSAAATAKL